MAGIAQSVYPVATAGQSGGVTFSAFGLAAPEAHPVICTGGTGILFRGPEGWGVVFTTVLITVRFKKK